MPRFFYILLLLSSSVPGWLFGVDDINITSPSAGDVYAGDDLSVSLNYASPNSGYSSPRWAYSSSSYGWHSDVESYSTSVGSSQWLNDLFDGYDSTRTLYVRLLDQASGAVLASDQRTFTYRSGSAPTQTESGGTGGGGGSEDSISIQKPYSGESVNSGNDELRISYSYSSASGGSQSPTWAYKLFDPNYGTPFSSYSSSHGGVQVNNMVSKYDFMSGQSDGSYTVYVTLLDSIGDMFNPPIVSSVSFNYQSSTGGTQSGSDGTQSGTSGTQSPDSIYITYPNVGTLYESGGNGLTIDWNYQSQDSAIQSLSWAYKLDEDFYGTQTNATQVDGTDSVDGSSWLSGLTADGGSYTLYVALLDQGSNVLATDSHSFNYNSGSDPYSSGGDGYQSGDSGYQSDDGTYQSGDGGYQSGDSGYQSPDSISIHYPDVSDLYSSEYNGLEVNWNYQSQDNAIQSLSWAYKLDEDFYGTQTSATQVDGNDSVDGSSWLSGLTADGGSHTLYVALLDQGSNVLATDNHGFTYQSGSSGTQSGGGGTQSPGGGYQTPSSGYQSPDGISIHYPDVSILYSSGLQWHAGEWNYQSQSNDMQSLSWAYKLDEDFYGTRNKCHASGRKRQCGRIELVEWLNRGRRKSYLVCSVVGSGK